MAEQENSGGVSTAQTASQAAPPLQKEKEVAPPNNVKYIGRRVKIDKATGAPELGENEEVIMEKIPLDLIPVYRRGGGVEFKLPAPEVQVEGFHCEDAQRLVREWPKEFKFIVEKGGAK